MTTFPSITGNRLIRALRKFGFEVIRVKGSHHFLINVDDILWLKNGATLKVDQKTSKTVDLFDSEALIFRLVVDTGKRDVIPKSMQLVAGRMGQEYNQRKNRRGAYWEDHYHAMAVESGDHLVRCLVYIDIHPFK